MKAIKSKIAISTFSILVGLLICAVIILISLASDNPPAASGFKFSEDPNAIEWSETIQNSSGKNSGIKIPGYSTIYFSACDCTVPMTLYNPKENDCGFIFELYTDNNEPFYTTGLINPGMAIEQLYLDKSFSKGKYDLTIKITPYDPQSGATLNCAEIKTDLIVQ
ncbi:MAG: hypothetical protein ACI4JX_06690 [Oscillospiraceae bacterium]